jgi:hypothetical protein
MSCANPPWRRDHLTRLSADEDDREKAFPLRCALRLFPRTQRAEKAWERLVAQKSKLRCRPLKLDFVTTELAAKRLELLRELLPGAARCQLAAMFLPYRQAPCHSGAHNLPPSGEP